ncbi:hypothetical protein BGZ99_008466, partial [Dissophora globulifera]
MSDISTRHLDADIISTRLLPIPSGSGSGTQEQHQAIASANSPLRTLRSKTSRSSISSTSSSSSNTTAQTFMSTLSFNTITGQHPRGTTQDDLTGSTSTSASRSRGISESGEGSNDDEVDEYVDLDSLDMSILTPLDSKDSNPFDTLNQGDSSRSWQRQQPQGERRSLYSYAESRRHTKTLSQHSSSAATQPLKQEEDEDARQEMMFASPYYRKSMALSELSDLAPGMSSGPAGRGSAFFVSDATSQYTNLLQEATSIIEQQHLDHIDSTVPDSHGIDGDSVDVPYQRHDLPRGEKATEAGSTSEQTQASSGTGSATRVRSRRFSAPGYHGSSHTSLSSLSRSSEFSLVPNRGVAEQDGAETMAPAGGVRAPQTFDSSQLPHDGASVMDSRLHLPGVHASIGIPVHDRSPSRHSVVPPLQHHATIQTYLPSVDDTVATGPSLVSNSVSQYLPQLHHDYRPGVVFEYYEGEWDWLPNFDEMKPDNAGILGNFMIDDTTEQDLFRQRYANQAKRQYKETGNFAVRFTTHIDITQDGVYSFWLSSNDGSVLYIANTLVVENDGMHYATEAEGRIMLQAGKHPMTVEFFHKNGKMLEGFRSTGPSLVVSYRSPGPIWSFGLKAGPKRIVKSSNLYYDYGDLRLKNLLREFGTDDYSSMSSPDATTTGGAGPFEGWIQSGGEGQINDRPSRHRIMSGDMGAMQPSTRELHVQMENAKTTIKDLEQIIRDQAESHKKRMGELYNILQDTQMQVDRMVGGLKKAALFDSPRTLIPPSLTNNPSWRNTVVSIYVDAEEDYPLQDSDQDSSGESSSGNENMADGDGVLAKHLADVEKLKQ